MDAPRLSFGKHERMVSRKLIDQLFGGGASRAAVVFPLRAVFMPVPFDQAPDGVQLLISVPKKRFRHAVDRNRAKRQVREAWRHTRQPLLDAVGQGKAVAVAFIWTAAEPQPSRRVAYAVKRLVQTIAERQ